MGRLALPIGVLAATALTGCRGDGPASPTEPAPFSLAVIPDSMPDVIASQRCVFLVTIESEGEGIGAGEAVGLSALVPRSTVTIEPPTLTSGQVTEVTVIPEPVITPPVDTLNLVIRGE